MGGVSTNAPLVIVEGNIDAGEARRAEWTGLMERYSVDVRCAQREIDDAPAALRCRRDYLRVMRAQP